MTMVLRECDGPGSFGPFFASERHRSSSSGATNPEGDSMTMTSSRRDLSTMTTAELIEEMGRLIGRLRNTVGSLSDTGAGRTDIAELTHVAISAVDDIDELQEHVSESVVGLVSRARADADLSLPTFAQSEAKAR